MAAMMAIGGFYFNKKNKTERAHEDLYQRFIDEEIEAQN